MSKKRYLKATPTPTLSKYTVPPCESGISDRGNHAWCDCTSERCGCQSSSCVYCGMKVPLEEWELTYE
jgi:hypothetical protein